MAAPPRLDLASAKALAKLMREERIAQVRIDADGQVTDMILHPTAYGLDEERRNAVADREQRRKASDRRGELPVEPGNPVREEMARRRPKNLIDGAEVADDDPDLYAHTMNPDNEA